VARHRNLAAVLHGREVGHRLFQEAKRGRHCGGCHFHFAKGVRRQPIYELTGLDFGAGLFVVTDFADARGHVSPPQV
jgi:hypothetical protein